jgi:flagellar hook-associated protein 3 FlgL
MRVSSLMFNQNYLPQLNQLEQSQNQLESEASSGLSMTLPEDNPAMMGAVLDLQAQTSANAQYQSNITQLQSSATTTSTALNALQPLLSQASAITLSVSAATNPNELANDADTVTSLITTALGIANTKDSSGNYIFGGTDTTTPPFVATTDANGNVTGVTYEGNSNVLAGDVAPNVTVATTIPGANTTGTGPQGLFVDTSSGADIFSHLISLQQHLASGDVTAVTSTDAANMTTDDNHVISQISANGVVQSTLESASTNTTEQGTNLSTQISNDTGADLATTLTKLTQTQTAYQAALESGVLVMNLSILPYIG